MKFEEIIISEMKNLEEGFFTGKVNTHKEISQQLSAHKNKPFIPSWAHKKMLELSDKEKYENAISNSPLKVVHPLMARKINNVGEKRIGAVKDMSVKTPIVIHNTRTGEMHLIAGNHQLQSNSDKIHTNTSVIAIPHED